MLLGCQPTAAAWPCPWQGCAGAIPHRNGLLAEITHLPVQAGQGLLFMRLILSALILGVVKNLKMTVQEELAGVFPCRTIWQQLRDSLSRPGSACSAFHPALPGAPTYCWPCSELIQQRKNKQKTVDFVVWFEISFPLVFLLTKAHLQGGMSMGRQRWREGAGAWEVKERGVTWLQGPWYKFALP